MAGQPESPLRRHILVFCVWMLVYEASPWPQLTLVVSLEAIFLSTFVLIGQNRGAAFQQAKADHDFTEQELELETNTDLTRKSMFSPLSYMPAWSPNRTDQAGNRKQQLGRRSAVLGQGRVT